MKRKPNAQTNIPGFGCIYLPKYKDRHGIVQVSAVWMMKYQTRDGFVRRSTKCKDQADAYAELMKMAGARASGQIVSSSPERVRIGQLLDMLLISYADKRTLYDLKCRVEKHIRPEFGGVKMIDLRKQDLEDWVRKLKREPLADASINRCLANLHRAFQIGADEDPPLVLRIPAFPWRGENNTRQGLLSVEHYRKLRDELAPHARMVLIIGYHTGMRRGEILKIRWDQVDLDAGVIHLEKQQTKTNRERVAPIYGEMKAYLEMAKAERDATYPDCQHVVAQNGKHVADVKTAWAAAVRRAGIPKILIHDLRRTALTNMEAANIPRHVAMSISGHKTQAVYERYLIGARKQAVDAGRTMEAYLTEKGILVKDVVKDRLQ
jgi:integrase